MSYRNVVLVLTLFLGAAALAAPPVGTPDTYNISKNNALVVTVPGVLANDSDPDGDPVTGAVLTGFAANGSLVWDGNGAFRFTPFNGFTGTTTFTYAPRANGETGNDVLITINVANDPPVAVNDSYTARAGETLTVTAANGVTDNDIDPNNDTLTVTLISGPSNAATFALNANGSFSYRNNAGFCGDDSFTYRVNDGTVDGNTATVTVHVNCPPVAVADSYVTPQGTPLTVPAAGVLANDSDPDGDAMGAVLSGFVAVGALVWNGDGSFTYTPPNAAFVGTVTFQYHPRANTMDGNDVTVTIKVNGAPAGTNDAYNVASGTTLNVAAPGVLANDTDPNADPLTATNASNPPNGTVTLNPDGSFSYTPDVGFTGVDSFTYQPHDGTAGGAATTVTINVIFNGPPVANADAYPVNEDAVLNVPAPGVLGNDVDVDALTAVLDSGPANGTLTLNPNGSFTYDSNANYHGPDSFTYHANDGTNDSNIVAVTITVNPLNDAPAGVADSYSTVVDTPLNVPAPGVLGNDTDADGQTLTAALFIPPSNGILALNPNGGFLYTPNAGFTGNDSFSYRASDGTANTPPITVTIEVAENVADVSVTKEATGPLYPGSLLTWRIVATNNGPGIATNVLVSDTLPAGTTFHEVTTTRGTCSGTTTVECTIGNLAPSESATIMLTVDTETSAREIENTAIVNHGSVDNDGTNDNATAAATVLAPIPTLSEWMMVALMGMLAVIAMRKM